MGVVYKFKKEVIDFVLQQKKADHGLGCRQLAALTSEKFKIQTSKSSINDIIKNANLSNSVGRRPSTESAPKKFQIPSPKKQQLLSEVQKVRIERKPVPAVVPRPPSRRSEVPSPRAERLPAGGTYGRDGGGSAKREQVAEPQKRGFSSVAFLRHVETLKARRSHDKGQLLDGMGCVFLKAAQWQLSRTSMLGGLLRKHIQEQLPPDFDAFCDVLPCLNVLGIDQPDQTGQSITQGLWSLNGFNTAPENRERTCPFPASRWLSAIRAVSPSLKFFMEYEKEKRQALMAVKRFEFCLEDGSKISTDAQLAGLWELKIPEEFSTCVEQAMSMLSRCVISNNQPAIFLSSAGRIPFNFIAALEGTEGKHIKKVDVWDVSGGRVAGFSAFPRKKRFFMLGVWPGQEEFSVLSSPISARTTSSMSSKNARAMEPFYDEEMDRIMYVAAGPAPIFQKEPGQKVASLRSITVLTSSGESVPIMVILTNCANWAPTDIVRAFIRRWPNLFNGPAGRAFNAAGSGRRACSLHENAAPDALWRAGQDPFLVFQDWGDALNQHCHEHFFKAEAASDDITPAISSCYSLPGYYTPREHVSLVSLCVPGTYSWLNELKLAVERVNEAGIIDPLGRSLCINNT